MIGLQAELSASIDRGKTENVLHYTGDEYNTGRAWKYLRRGQRSRANGSVDGGAQARRKWAVNFVFGN